MTRKGTEWCAFDFELWSGECREACGCLAARRCHDWLVYTKLKTKKANTNQKPQGEHGKSPKEH